MASPLQQQSVRRKLIYTGLILVLFGITTFGVRGLELPRAPAPWWTVTGQANSMEIRPESQGEVELTGSAIRLSLTGSRGFAICVLWDIVREKQKRHEWNELEIIVRSLTKLQPHFITPWLFQSWNLAYNVSVESDLVKDKYFYVTRGIELLAEGERQNRDHPDLRFSMGFTNQHKIGLADEANTLRSLYQMSSMDPHERDPKWLGRPDDSGKQVVIPERFELFCQRHPMLVRRLRESLRCQTKEDVVDFLQANWDVPSRYEDQPQPLESDKPLPSPLKAPHDQFPILPPRFAAEFPELADEDHMEDEHSNYTVARAWYSYSLKPMPPPEAKPMMVTPNPDPTKYHLPRYIAQHIFRGYPARAQIFIAEDVLVKEGWFDRDGWLIRGWFPDDRFSSGREARVGDGQPWAREAWDRAYRMYQLHGTLNGLYKTPEELQNLEQRAQKYRTAFNLAPYEVGVEPTGDRRTPEMLDSYSAHDQLHWYERHRQMTNFPHFYFRSQVEADDKTVAARKAFFEAEQLRKQARREQSLARFAAALTQWRDIMLAHPDFAHDGTIQEDSFELQLKYTELAQDLYGRRVKPLLVLQDYLTQAAQTVPGTPFWPPPPQLVRDMKISFVGPLDAVDKTGNPLIPPDTRVRVQLRLGMNAPAPPPPAIPPPVLPEGELPKGP